MALFFVKSDLYLALFCCFGEWDSSVCSIYGYIDGRMEKCFRGQFGVPLMVWKEKRGRGIVPFFLLLGRVLFLELSFWNNTRSRFF